MKEFYDDFVGCCVQSLVDNYADYCFDKQWIKCIASRLKREGLGTTSLLVIPIKDNDKVEYWHLLPIQVYRKYTNEKGKEIEQKLRHETFVASKMPDRFKYTFIKDDREIIIKDYKDTLQTNILNSIIEYTNRQND